MFWPIHREEPNMKKTMALLNAASAGLFLLSGPAGAHGSSRTVNVAKVEVQKLPSGYRASKVIGSSVMNDAHNTIGKIDDLIVSTQGRPPFAVLSVGGFLGVDAHLVALPYDNLKVAGSELLLPGGTKAMLMRLPEFKY
jgi:hypothetical protein